MATALVDLDNTLIDLTSAILSAINLDADTYKDIYCYDSFISLCGANKFNELINSDELYREVAPYDGAKQFLQDLKGLGFNISIVSAGKYLESKHELIHHNFEEYVDSVVFDVTDKTTVHGDFLVDDSFDNVYNWVRNTNTSGFLFTNSGRHYYNQHIWRHPKFYRVNNYKDILYLVKGEYNIIHRTQ